MTTEQALLWGSVGGVIITALIELVKAKVRKRRLDRHYARQEHPAFRDPLLMSAREVVIASYYGMTPEKWASLTDSSRAGFRDSYYKARGI